MSLIVLLCFFGLIAFLISKAPFIAEPYKGYALWVLLVFAVIAVFYFFFGPVDFNHLPTRRRG